MPRPFEIQSSHFDTGKPGKERNVVYLIQVGRNSRRGTFNKLHEKVILVEDGSTFYEVEKHFKNKYEGFEVIIKPIIAEPIKGIEHRVIDDEEKTPQSCIGNFKIQYTEDEKRLHDEYVQFSKSATSSLNALYKAIEGRYKQLFYSDIEQSYYNSINRTMELTTDDYETRCLKFPVRADLFIEAAKDCNGTVPEKVTPTEFLEADTAAKAGAEVLDGTFPDDDLEPEIGSNAYASDDVPF
jgi:hypothetical protein